jgi:hypothetical protein
MEAKNWFFTSSRIVEYVPTFRVYHISVQKVLI